MCAFLPGILPRLCLTWWKLQGDCTSIAESEASFIAEHKHHLVEWCVFQKSDPWTILYILFHDSIRFIQLTVCIHAGFLCVKRDWSFLTTCLRGVEEQNVYSCTQCWHLKSGEVGFHSSGVYALIVFFSPSFHGPRPRRTKFPSNWMPAKSRWPGHWDPVFGSRVQHKHSILFVGPANIKYLKWQG